MNLIQDMANATLTLAVQRDGRITVIKNRQGAVTDQAALEELVRLIDPRQREILRAALEGCALPAGAPQPG
ncbi:hypothetical protein [Methylobacterium ajmalii]|uniref:hypothetical protein n=1 Tax=Methylobacterium ajmalii TaxID=2738439 RepID=UPI002F352AB2